MLKFLSSIKHETALMRAFARHQTLLLLASAFLIGISSAVSEAQPTLAIRTPNKNTPPPHLGFLASARLKSPDRLIEVSTPEIPVNLSGRRTATLQGSALRVTLESERSDFSQTQLVRVSVSGSAGQRGEKTSFFGGTFKISDNGQHNFLVVEKSKGWLLEVKLRPLGETNAPPQSQPQTNPSEKVKPPAFDWNSKKAKRAPA